jgi:hypothetical protein
MLFCSFYNKAVISTVGLGGGERVRTDDLLRARQALSQLSYTPNKTYDLIVSDDQKFAFSIQFSIVSH